MNLKNKLIIITGAAGGIGSNLAMALDALGANLILLDIDQTKLDSLNKILSKPHTTEVVNLTDASAIEEFAQKITKKNLRIDILINNAGIGIYKKISDLSPQEIETSIKVNLTAPFLLIHFLIRSFNKPAKILNVGSICGIKGQPERSAYCTTKFGLRGMSLSLSEELKSSNIDVCYVTLGSTLTEFGPLTIKDKEMIQSQGKKYFKVEDVVVNICKLLQQPDLNQEIVLDPEA